MESKEIYNGNYVIYENGSLYSNISKKYLKGGFVCRNKNYLTYCIHDNKRQLNVYAHRLVAENFILNQYNLPQVNHVDGNSRNNSVYNLEWCTASRNTQHAYDIGLMKIETILNAKYENLCSVCGKHSHKDMCHDHLSLYETKNQRINRYNFLKEIKTSTLSNRYIEIISLLISGHTQVQVADRIGVTAQRINQIIKNFERVWGCNGCRA